MSSHDGLLTGKEGKLGTKQQGREDTCGPPPRPRAGGPGQGGVRPLHSLRAVSGSMVTSGSLQAGQQACPGVLEVLQW